MTRGDTATEAAETIFAAPSQACGAPLSTCSPEASVGRDPREALELRLVCGERLGLISGPSLQPWAGMRRRWSLEGWQVLAPAGMVETGPGALASGPSKVRVPRARQVRKGRPSLGQRHLLAGKPARADGALGRRSAGLLPSPLLLQPPWGRSCVIRFWSCILVFTANCHCPEVSRRS